MESTTTQQVSSTRRAFVITKLERHPEHGYWRARVTCEGVTLEVHRRFGSWLAEVRTAPRARTFNQREVLPHVAAELQRKVKRLERREGVVA